jgi:hypothetical protein
MTTASSEIRNATGIPPCAGGFSGLKLVRSAGCSPQSGPCGGPALAESTQNLGKADPKPKAADLCNNCRLFMVVTSGDCGSSGAHSVLTMLDAFQLKTRESETCLNFVPPFTPRRERASGKALAFLRSDTTYKDLATVSGLSNVHAVASIVVFINPAREHRRFHRRTPRLWKLFHPVV